jgi:branched-chain amino acid transport system ATP-binding protein
MSAETLTVSDVTLAFSGTTVLEGVSLEVAPGERVGILGPNGAGKTSTLNVICGVVRVQGGSVNFGGRRLDRMRPHQIGKLGVGRSFQTTEYFGSLTPIQLMLLHRVGRSLPGAARHGGLIRSTSRDPDVVAARAALERVGLAEFIDEPLTSLPYGIQKRADFARALDAGPALALLDEPTSGLAVEEREQLGALLTEERAGGRSFLVIDHDPDFLAANCDRLVAMNFGRVLTSGTPREVLTNPEVAESYLGPGAEPPTDPSTSPPAPATERGPEGGA